MQIVSGTVHFVFKTTPPLLATSRIHLLDRSSPREEVPVRTTHLSTMAATRRMRTAFFVAFWALAGVVAVMHGALQYTNPAVGRSIEALPSRAVSQRGTASNAISVQDVSKQDASKQSSESRTGPGLYAVLGVATAAAMCFGMAIQPAAASDDGIIRLLKAGTLPQTFGQNNINNGVGGNHRANLSAATQSNLLQLLLPLAGIVGIVNVNRAGNFQKRW